MRLQHVAGLMRELANRIFDNRWLKILSLVLAILLFRFSNQPVSVVRITGVPIEFQGLPVGMEIVHIDSPVVSLQVRGPQNMVTGLTPNQISVTANLADKDQGERVAQLQTANVKLPDRIEILSISPTFIRLRLERTISRNVRVIPMTEGQLPPGLEVYETSIQPETILVEGPQRDLERVTHFSTETINLDRLSSSYKSEVDVEVPTPMRFKDDQNVELSIIIGEKRQKRLFIIPVSIRDDQSATKRITPRRVEVELFGPASLIKQIESSDITAEISLNGTLRSETLIAPVIKIPDRFQNQISISAIKPANLRIN